MWGGGGGRPQYILKSTHSSLKFCHAVTEPKYNSNLIPSSKALSLPKEGRHVVFSGEFVDEEGKELGKDPNKDKTLLAGLRPILSELNGYDSSLGQCMCSWLVCRDGSMSITQFWMFCGVPCYEMFKLSV